MHYVYIIYSVFAGRFYIGETEDIDIRLKQHNNSFFKGSSTTVANDWQLKFLIKLESRTDARKVETYIKSMKSRKFIERLIDNAEFYKNFKSMMNNKFDINIL